MKKILTFLFLLSSCLLMAQEISISGTVIDASTKETLTGATIIFEPLGEVTDYKGQFAISVSKNQKLTFQYVGYEEVEYVVAESKSDLIIEMSVANNVLEAATVTGSRFEQNLGESTISIDIIPTKLIENTNTVNISSALERVPGVQVIDGQANIRGGSGFSYGAGSRVMLLLNDMPILQPDAGYPSWTDIPVENISQVEVLKGSASAMYGSAALNGIVNVRTKYATSEPETNISIGGRVFNDFKREEIIEAEGLARELFVSASHRSKVNKDWDIVIHGFYNDLESYADSTYEHRGRVGFSTKYRITDRLNIGLNTMLNKADNSSFFLWGNQDSLILFPFPQTVSKTKNTRYIIDPFLTYSDVAGNQHKIQARYYRLKNDNSLNQSNSSQNLFSEYQFFRDIENIDTKITSGIVNQYLNTDSALFSDAKFSSYNLGVYAQLDKRWFERLNSSFGWRYELNSLNVPVDLIVNGENFMRQKIKDGKHILKFGLNYQATDYTFIRGSFGQGYRFPTVVERFINTTFGSFSIFSNPALLPESGYSSELGVKQGFSLLGFKGFIDLAIFQQEYENMMEFVFGPLDGRFGFQSNNVGNTRIRGIETGLAGEFYIKKHPIRVFGGYTYIDPKYKNFENNFTLEQGLSTSDPTINVLKYRSKHTFKMDIEATINAFTLGASATSASEMTNIDAAFYDFDIPEGLSDYRQNFGSDYFVLDFRTSYAIKNATISLLVKNALNKEYTVRPAELSAPRNIGFRLSYKI